MDEIIAAIIKELELFHDSIKDALDSKNITTFGEAAKSLRIDVNKDSIQSIGIFYLEFLNKGRGPGKRPPIEPLKNWAAKKFGVDEKEAAQIAFAVATKIAQLGTIIFRYNKEGIELEKKVLILRENINKSVRKSVIIEIKQVLNRFKLEWQKKNNSL